MNHVIKKTIISLSFIALLITPMWAEPSGFEIMQKVYNRDTGNDMKADLSMEITNSRGATRERSIVQIRKVEEGVEKKSAFDVLEEYVNKAQVIEQNKNSIESEVLTSVMDPKPISLAITLRSL